MSNTSQPYGAGKARKTVTAPDIQAMKGGDSRIACLTAYDYATGVTADESGADLVLVGDSLAMVVLGHEDTLSVTMEEMIHHTRAASRGVKKALLVADMPFMSYHVSLEQAVANAGRLVQEGRAKAVKLEGGRNMAERIRAIVDAGIPVMGHLGLTPQSVNAFGGFKAQAKTAEAVQTLVEDALALVDAGIFSLVLEAMPAEAAELVTARIPVPTIGIGAGNVTDGQILVWHDVLGMFDRFTPKFVRRYAELGKEATTALSRYCEDVRHGRFPAEKNTIRMSDEELPGLKKIKPKKRK
ncbi:3-methyl-2-oxobutanoate hydroxymethyltransferase [Salidesulfovibrio onnuriiensis]|uniref:3-methyl-2-oxobutanoate hydroxymethyltransferase n=1 Tax=Salidesulfovibrio onnuriiensis TaxID=2583823 RepID=UPI0011CC14FC|nr:3-methyl-2-oxobutanoate hydroxymethyltransferase [Salidesulfovibrio onnuriiensis]